MISDAEAPKPPSAVEGIKDASNFLRGTILEGLADESRGDVTKEDYQLLKFHGTYLQDDRDLRKERRKAKLEPAYSFMLRVRVPGGVCSPKQYLVIDDLADKYANGTIKLTTRQAFQLHGILKGDLKPTIREINDALMDTLAACGDVNRNVMCNVNPHQSAAHAEAYEMAAKVSEHLTPKTRAYWEIWMDEERVAGTPEQDDEPIYGKHYLPRKFKTGFAIPPSNDVDIFTQDLGYIAIIEDGKVVGYNVTAGGGMGMTHGKKATFPRLADVLGFVTPDGVIPAAEAIVTTQRDFGDRSDRKHARLKYTIEDRGVEWFRGEVESRMGFKFEPARDVTFADRADPFGWTQGEDGQWHATLFVENGRVRDGEGSQSRTGLREVAKVLKGEFRLTANQHIVVGNVAPEDKDAIDNILKQYDLIDDSRLTGLRRNASACVAMPTCGLALTESERYLPKLIDLLDEAILDAGLKDDAIVIRMTGCPNGCARPYNAEIGLVGRAPGKYNVYLGGANDGSRLAKPYAQAMKEEDIVGLLTPLFKQYATEREDGESFGDFLIRKDVVEACLAGATFHD